MAGQMPGSVANRQMDWGTPIQSLLPNFKLAYPDAQANARLTLGDLYAHRSGLPDHAGDQLEDVGYSRAEVLQRLRHVLLDPYGHYAYTNFGLTAAAEAMAHAAGTDWATLSERTLYQPLGMKHTSSRYADFVARDNRAWGHVQKGVDYDSYGAMPAQYEVQNPPRQPDAQSPAGGVSSSVADMAQWMALVLAKGQWGGKRLLSAAALQQAMTARPGGKYGYGFNVGPDPQGNASVSHSGAFLLGAHTAFFIWPEADLGITVLTNAQPRGVAEAIGLIFGERALGAAPGNVPGTDWLTTMQNNLHSLYKPAGAQLVGQAPPDRPKPSQPLASYTGRYTNSYYGDVRVALSDKGKALQLTLGPAQVRHQLRHWDGDLFAFEWRGENAPSGSISAVQFTANQMVIEYYSEDLLQGRFERVSDTP
jgi:CubicO group peptidase (beta-lactamase class C family)